MEKKRLVMRNILVSVFLVLLVISLAACNSGLEMSQHSSQSEKDANDTETKPLDTIPQIGDGGNDTQDPVADTVVFLGDYQLYYNATMDFYSVNRYLGYEDNIIIPSEYNGVPIKRIDGGAFAGVICDSITIPKNISVIEDCAFFGSNTTEYSNYKEFRCTVKQIIFEEGSSLGRIGKQAFYGCERLSEIKLPSSVKYIEAQAFMECGALKHVELSPKIVEISAETFQNCTSLVSIDIPDSVTKIYSSAFSGCIALESVSFPTSLTDIESSAFHGCKALKNVSLNDGLTTIKGCAFEGCGIENLYLPKTLKAIDRTSFSGCNKIKSITIDGENETYQAMGNCIISKKDKVLRIAFNSSTIPDDGSVVAIGEYAFYYCDELTDVKIPETVIEIGNSAFYGCASLENIELHSKIEKIGSGAFDKCDKLNYTVHQEAKYLGIQDNPLLVLVEVLPGSEECFDLPYETRVICAGAFSDRRNLEGITLRSGLRAIPENLFSNMTALRYVSISGGLVEIGEGAFARCKNLSSINIPESVEKIGGSAFAECSSLGEMTFNEGLIEIGTEAFVNCKEILYISLPSTLKHIGGSAFRGCIAVETVYFAGTRAQWEAMERGSSWDGEINGYAVRYKIMPSDEEHINTTDNALE